jgi:hypothetical protein
MTFLLACMLVLVLDTPPKQEPKKPEPKFKQEPRRIKHNPCAVLPHPEDCDQRRIDEEKRKHPPAENGGGRQP